MKIPLHKKIRADLLGKIEAGEYEENQLIPTEMELAEQYQVSRPTVRQAVQSLVNEGYLEKRKKRGTLVKKPKIQQEFTHVIDLNRMCFSRIDMKTGCKNFERLTASAEDIEIIGGKYAEIRKFDKAQCISLIKKYSLITSSSTTDLSI